MKFSKGWLIPAVLLAVLIALIAYSLRPSAVVDRALKRLGRLESGNITATVELKNVATTQQLLNEEGTITIVYSGDIMRNKAGADEAAGQLAVNIATDSVQVQAAGEVRLVDDQIYLNVSKAPTVFPALVQLKNQWVRLHRGGAKNVDNHKKDSASFTSYERQGYEQVNDRRAAKYATQATGEAVVSMMDAVANFLGTELSSEQVAALKAGVDNKSKVPVDIWIKPFSQKVVQIKARVDTTSGNNIGFTLAISGHNKDVDIAAPAESKTIEQIVHESQNE